MIQLKRAYEAPDEADGYRVLVDRIWPRGIKKTALAIDVWLKTVAPSTELRRWFAHDPKKWPEFCTRYNIELAQQHDTIKLLREKSHEGQLTLVYGAKDTQYNNAVALKQYLEARSVFPPSPTTTR